MKKLEQQGSSLNYFLFRENAHNKTLHRTAIPLHSIATGELTPHSGVWGSQRASSYFCNYFQINNNKLESLEDILTTIDRLAHFEAEQKKDITVLERYNPDKSLWYSKKHGYKNAGIDVSPIFTEARINEIMRCQEDVFYFIENYLFIRTRDKDQFGNRVRPFTLRKYQREQIELYMKNRFTLLMYPRRSGKTSGTVAYFLWKMLFQNDFLVVCLANKDKVAMKLIAELKVFVKYLPLWMTEGIMKLNEHQIMFENGSNISALATTGDAGRSEGANIVYLDECVAHDTKITIRDKSTGEIKKVSIGELFVELKNEHVYLKNEKGKVYLNTRYEVLTKNGFCDFHGIRNVSHDSSLTINFNNGSNLTCSHNHKIMTPSGYVYAKDIKVGDVVYSDDIKKISVTVIEESNKPVELYDLIHVDNDSHNYITNETISSNCAFIEPNVWEEFYAAIYPVVCDGEHSQLLGTSTPNGMNHFYQLWEEGSLVDDDGNVIKEGTNQFVCKTIPWDAVPGRDEEFKRKTIATIGEQGFAQDFQCEFLGSAGTFIPMSTLKTFVKKRPLEIMNIFDKYELLVYTRPIDDHYYIVTHDPASGHGGEKDDSTAIIVWDVTNINKIIQVASLTTKHMDSIDAKFALHKICELYNEALEISERNKEESIPAQIFNELRYENVFHDKKNFPGFFQTQSSRDASLGVIKRFLTEGKIEICDPTLISEFNSFIKINSKYQAEKGKHDDCIMSMALLGVIFGDPEYYEKYMGDITEAEFYEFRDIPEEYLGIMLDDEIWEL